MDQNDNFESSSASQFCYLLSYILLNKCDRYVGTFTIIKHQQTEKRYLLSADHFFFGFMKVFGLTPEKWRDSAFVSKYTINR